MQYSAIAQALYLDDSKYLEVRHNLINFLNNNLRTVQSVMAEICHPRETINNLDAKEFLDNLEDPSNDQTILLAFCAVALNYKFSILYFNERGDIATWEYSPNAAGSESKDAEDGDNTSASLSNSNHSSNNNNNNNHKSVEDVRNLSSYNFNGKPHLSFLLKSPKQVLPLVCCEAYSRHQFQKLFCQKIESPKHRDKLNNFLANNDTDEFRLNLLSGANANNAAGGPGHLLGSPEK